MHLPRYAKIIIVILVVVGVGVGIKIFWRQHGAFGAHKLTLDLQSPDVLIQSARLSQLPRDALQVPLLRDVLTEDFVFYYEQTDARLSIQGALRRLAFEHDIGLSDRLLADVLDEPAEMALWKGNDGRLRYWALNIRRNTLGNVFSGLAKVAMTDSQLRIAGNLRVDGADVTVYALHLSPTRALLIAAANEHIVVLSDAGMLFDERKPGQNPKKEGEQQSANAAEEQSDFYGQRQDAPMEPPDELTNLLADNAEKLETLLSAKQSGNSFLSRAFGLEEIPPQGHRVAVTAHYLSFGYQTFFPAIDALRFDFNGKEWSSHIYADGSQLSSGEADRAKLWQSLPGQAAACVALPLDWSKTESLAGLSKGIQGAKADQALSALRGPLGLCWYAKSRLATPLFVTQFKDAAVAEQTSPILQKMFEETIGSGEYNRDKSLRFPVEVATRQDATVFQRTVSSPYGTERPKNDELANQLSSTRYFPVTLALSKDVAAFSPDTHLVDDTLSTLSKRYPSSADGQAKPGKVLMRITPAQIAQIAQDETFAALPKDSEPIFRNVAQTQLMPHLTALSKYDPITVSLPDSIPSGRGWIPLTWTYDHN